MQVKRGLTRVLRPVTDFKVAEDDVEGPVLLSASTAGTVYTWSMKKIDRGEICAQLRSLSLKELILPPTLLLMTMFQLCSFAFGPATMWRKSVRQTIKYGADFFLLGTEVSIEFAIKSSDKFWWELAIVVPLMVVFLLCEALGAYQVLNKLQGRVQSSKIFKDADVQGSWSHMHLLRRALTCAQCALSLGVWFCCSVGVAPVFKICAQALRCSQAEADAKYYLDVTGGHAIECWMVLGWPCGLRWEETHAWSYCSAWLLPLACTYLVGLAPFAVVSGDASYVQRDELLDYKRWEFNAERKATALNLGFFHPNPQYIFRALLTEMASKAILPMITWMVVQPHLQMTLASALMALLFAQSMLFPPFINRRYCAIVQGCRLFALCTMLCGLITVIIGSKRSILPIGLLALCFALVAALTYYRLMQAEEKHQYIVRRHTSDPACAAS